MEQYILYGLLFMVIVVGPIVLSDVMRREHERNEP